MGFAGRLEGIAPSDIFQIISQNRMTGTLVARCPDRTAMVVFKDGQVIEATSDAPQESLGHLLVSQGLTSRETIEAARERLKQEPNLQLGAILVQMGVISETNLRAVVLRQIGHIVNRLMSCDDGFITFDRGELALKRKLNTREFLLASGVSAEYLIMERARVADEDRRSGSDRRSRPRGPAAESEPAQEHAAAPAAAVRPGLSAWFRALAADLRGSAGSVSGKGKQLAGATAHLVRRTLPWFRTAWNKVRAFSPDGRAMVFAGIGGIAAGIALILATTLSFPKTGSELVVIGKVVKLRAKPTTEAGVVVKIPQGETVSQVEFKEGWHQVRTKAGDTGWIWKNLVEERKKGPRVRYAMKGFELVLIAGIALLVAGIRRRRRAGSTARSVAVPSGE